MYANLQVTTASGEQLCAHEVTIEPDGTVRVGLDDPESESSYAEPAGTRVFAPGEDAPLSITADF